MGQERLAGHRKKGTQVGHLIVFVDETGISLIPNARKTWAKRGKTPILRHQFRWPKLSAIAAITPVGKLYFRVHDDSIKEDQVIAFVKHLLRHTRKYLVILWDGGPSHRSNKTKAFLTTQSNRVEVHRLPAYAPELNPIELLFSHLKNQQLANVAPHNEIELRQVVRKATVRIRNHPARIRRIIQGSDLPCAMLLNQRLSH